MILDALLDAPAGEVRELEVDALESREDWGAVESRRGAARRNESRARRRVELVRVSADA